MAQDVTNSLPGNKNVTHADPERIELRKKLRNFYHAAHAAVDGGAVCPVKDVFVPSLDKWSLLCMYNLAYHETLRFSKLKKYVPGVSSRMLSVTLKKLEMQEIVARRVFPEVPPRVEYSLTPFGKAYSKRMLDLNLWVWEARQKSNPELV